MTRTIWGAHKRYMDTYLNVYKGYYVRTREQLLRANERLTGLSLLVMALAATTKATTGSVDESMMW